MVDFSHEPQRDPVNVLHNGEGAQASVLPKRLRADVLGE